MLIDKNEYRESLSDLWNKVFGDDYSFIKLIFNNRYDNSILCFAEIEDGKTVSAFYLIENELSFNGEAFSGYYLYAAATLPEYRGRGLMSSLIRQAQDYCCKNNKDYISLVPSQTSLYNYYASLGFCEAMYRYISVDGAFSADSAECTTLTSPQQILDLRRCYKGNSFNFTDNSFLYAFECMKHSGFEFKATGEDVLLIDSDDTDSFSELVSADDEKANEYANKISTKGALTSPFELTAFNSSKAVPYGMIYPINTTLVRNWNFTDIYMNIALD